MRYFFHMGLVALVSVAVAQEKADQCNPDYCRLPDCYCGGNKIPGGLKPEQIPQLVLLTFDDAVNDLNKAFFKKLYEGRTNPNGCPIKVRITRAGTTCAICAAPKNKPIGEVFRG